MNAGLLIRDTRLRCGLTQSQLAARAGTSQATLSAYESGAREPSLATLNRILTATGARLVVVHDGAELREPSRTELARAGRTLVEVLGLAEALPVRHAPDLRYPRLSAGTTRL